MLWNVHAIRRTKNHQICFGRPILMYTSPGAYGTTDYLCRVEHFYVDACKDDCIFKDNISFTSDADVNDLCVNHKAQTFRISVTHIQMMIKSCARDIMSCGRDNMSCVRYNKSCARDNMSCARPNFFQKKKLCVLNILPYI